MATVGAAQPSSGSLRLAVDPERKSVVAGNTLRVSVGLRDAHDQPSAAPSAFVVTIAVAPPVAGAATAVTIPAGQPAATLQLTPSAPGILQIRAMHPQAFEGGAFVRVVPSVRGAPGTAEPPPPEPPPPPAPPLADLVDDERGRGVGSAAIGDGSARGRGSSSAPPARPLRSPASEPAEREMSQRPGGPPRAAPAPATETETGGGAPVDAPAPAAKPAIDAPRAVPPPAADDAGCVGEQLSAPGDASASAPSLRLCYSPRRGLLADGRDAATIEAFLISGVAPDGGLRVNLHASSGTLRPQPLVVQGFVGQSTLTSDRPGDVDVELVSSPPYAVIKGGRSLRIHFGPPIHGLRLEAKPAAISLVDQTDLIVTLIDAGGRAVATDEPRAVWLALDRGRGEIERKELIVKPGEFEARTRFVATSVGEVEVSAASASLLNQTARLDVRLPLGLLALSVVGGLVGGLLAFFRRRGARWTRVAIGSVTGFLLYWTFIFGLMRVMPRAFVLNPLSNFALSTIGGWLGTEVFALLLQRLGLSQPRGREDRGGGKPKPKHGRTRRSGGA